MASNKQLLKTANSLVSLGKVNYTSGPVTVNYSVTGSASQGPDFSIPGSVTIAVGASDATIDVTVSNDSNLENTEFVTVSLLTPVSTGSVTIGSGSIASLSITDVEPTTATITAISPGTISEATTVDTPQWLVSLSNVNNTGAPITVNYSVLPGSTADDPADYNFLSGSVTIADGQSTAQVLLSAKEDSIVEANETIILQLNNTNHASVTYSSTPATVTIVDNDSATVSIAPQGGPSFAESADPVFVVSLSKPASSPTIVTYTLGTGATPAATPGLDFVSPTGTVSFGIGVVSAFITVDVSDDILLESSEKLVVSLTGSIDGDTDYSFGTSTATATITDNETASVSVVATDPSAFETGEDPATFTVSLTKVNDSAGPITVTYTLGGDASTVSGVDYSSLSGFAVIPVGSSDVVVTVTPTNDATIEANETVTLTLGSNNFGSSLTNSSSNSATVTIFDNDGALVSVSTPSPVVQIEATTSRTFTLNLTHPSSTPTVVAYTISGSATSGSDFNSLVGSATVPAGVTSFDIPVTVVSDTLVEPSETVVITLTSISSGDPSVDIDNSNKVSSLTITDDDSVTLSSFRYR